MIYFFDEVISNLENRPRQSLIFLKSSSDQIYSTCKNSGEVIKSLKTIIIQLFDCFDLLFKLIDIQVTPLKVTVLTTNQILFARFTVSLSTILIIWLILSLYLTLIFLNSFQRNVHFSPFSEPLNNFNY